VLPREEAEEEAEEEVVVVEAKVELEEVPAQEEDNSKRRPISLSMFLRRRRTLIQGNCHAK
jgi:hypothetical protein